MEPTPDLLKTTDLGHNWEANQYSDGSMLLFNRERKDCFVLPTDSVERLRTIIKVAETA